MSATVTKHEKKYRVVDGTFYDERTPVAVTAYLEAARKTRNRIRLRYGDAETGRDWLEEHDIEGYVGRSTGEIKIPLIVHNARSSGGPGILDHCIVRIIDTKTHRVLWSHPKYNRPEFTTRKTNRDTFEVLANGQLHARFKTQEAADRWIKKMSQ